MAIGQGFHAKPSPTLGSLPAGLNILAGRLSGFFPGQKLRAERVNLRAEVKWPQLATGGGGGRGGGEGGERWVRVMLPRKILKFDAAKQPFYDLLMLRASHFFSPDIREKDILF